MDILRECFPSHRQEMTRFREALAVAEAQEAYKLAAKMEEGQELRLEDKQIDGTAGARRSGGGAVSGLLGGRRAGLP